MARISQEVLERFYNLFSFRCPSRVMSRMLRTLELFLVCLAKRTCPCKLARSVEAQEDITAGLSSSSRRLALRSRTLYDTCTGKH